MNLFKATAINSYQPRLAVSPVWGSSYATCRKPPRKLHRCAERCCRGKARGGWMWLWSLRRGMGGSCYDWGVHAYPLMYKPAYKALTTTPDTQRERWVKLLWRISPLCGGSFTFTPGHSRAKNLVVNLLRPHRLEQRRLGFGRTAANIRYIPHVAWYRNSPKSMVGVDCGPWMAAVSGDPGWALNLDAEF